jgi:WD40 repeat protein
LPWPERAVRYSQAHQVFFYDVETEQRQNISKFLKHSNRAQIVHWDKDLLYSFGWDGNLFVWDIRQTDPVATQFVTCPNKDSFVISEETLLVGLVQKKDNLLAFDLRKQGPVTRMTVESKQAAQSLPPNDKLAEIQILRRAHFDNSKYFVTTSHNNTLQLLDYNGAKMVSVYSYEALDQPVLALETSVLRSKVFFTGDGFYGGLEFDN